MDYNVYILFSRKDGKLYIGQTNNLNKRLKEHNSGLVFSTKNRRPLVLIRNEKFNSRSKAMNREKFLKSLYGYKARIKILKEFLSDGSSCQHTGKN
jgi:putative endonuclease